MLLINCQNKIVKLKHFVRVMNIVKKEHNVHNVSFLTSWKRNLFLDLTKHDFDILTKINGINSLKEILSILNIEIDKVISFINGLIEKYNIVTSETNKNENIYDRHDLFFDSNFKIENFTDKIIKNKTILIVGCGWIENDIISMFTKSGVENFILIDNDKIENTNLTRQFLFFKSDIGKYKIDILEKRIYEINPKATILKYKIKFNQNIIKELKKTKKIDFAYVSADTPQTIAMDAYQVFTSLRIPFTTVDYLNDFGIVGPIIDNYNIKYDKFVNTTRNQNNIIKKMNDNYQSSSFGPLNSFVSSLAVYDMFKYFVNKNQCKTYNKKIIINFNSLLMQEVDFSPIKIGVFNSSSNLAYNYQHRVKNTIKIFKENNYEIELGKLSFKKGNYRSGSIKERSDEFNHLLKNTNVLMSMIGGFNSSSILNEIDYEYIKKNNIKIVGCSDTTSILLAIYKNTNIPVYYGPSFLMSYDEQNYIKQFNLDIFFQKVIQDFPGVLKYPNKITIQKHDWKNTKIINKKLIKNRIKILNVTNDVIEGRLLGGNLNTMASLIGTKFMPEFKKGDILFIEDSHVLKEICQY